MQGVINPPASLILLVELSSMKVSEFVTARLAIDSCVVIELTIEV